MSFNRVIHTATNPANGRKAVVRYDHNDRSYEVTFSQPNKLVTRDHYLTDSEADAIVEADLWAGDWQAATPLSQAIGTALGQANEAQGNYGDWRNEVEAQGYGVLRHDGQ